MANPPPPPFNENARTVPPPEYNKSAPVAKSVSNISAAHTPSNQVAPPAPPGPPAPPPAANGSQRVIYNERPQQPPPPSGGEQEPLKQKVIYVDQYGNPITGEASQRVLNNPPPVAAGSGESEPLKPKYQYVDSSGRLVTSGTPVTQPLTNTTSSQRIQYVDQNGNPLNIQTVHSSGQIQQQQNTTSPKQEEISQKQKAGRIAVFVIGCISTLMLFIGLCVNNLAHYSTSYATLKCGYTSLILNCDTYDCGGYYDDEAEYADSCSTANPEACKTQAAALVALFTMLIAFIETVVGTIFVQTFCSIKQCCLEGNKYLWGARVHFGVAVVMSLLGLIIWIAVDEICMTEASPMELGSSMILNIIGMVINIIALIVLFSTGSA